MKLLSLVIPTVRGREEYLERALDAYTSRAECPTQMILVHDQESCGRAWNLGAQRARGDYIHLGADDVEPHEGYATAAIEAVEKGAIPSAVYYNPAGELEWANGPAGSMPGEDWEPCQDGMRKDGWYMTAMAPFCSAAQYERIGPTIDAHYGSDDFFSFRAVKCGYPIVLRTAFAFTHHSAPARRGAGMEEFERHMHDTEILNAAIAADPD
jgi:hypothetical protein